MPAILPIYAWQTLLLHLEFVLFANSNLWVFLGSFRRFDFLKQIILVQKM